MMSFYALDSAEQKNCMICGQIGGEGHHRHDCPVPVSEKAILAAKQIMYFEWHIDGDDTNDEDGEYFKAVGLARQAVGDYTPDDEDDEPAETGLHNASI